jgi:putative acetyltransferase
MRDLLIRPYRPEDAAHLARVFHRAVRRSTGAHYSLVQRVAWSPRAGDGADWHDRLSGIETIVAELPSGPVGFMALNAEDSFVDFAYVDPSVRGHGVGAALYAVIEGRARAMGLGHLQTEASRVAEPFFRARGWVVLHRQVVKRRFIGLPNALMEKDFAVAEAAA